MDRFTKLCPCPKGMQIWWYFMVWSTFVWTRFIDNDIEIICMSLLLLAPNSIGKPFNKPLSSTGLRPIAFTTGLSRHSDQDKNESQDYSVPNLLIVYPAPWVPFTSNLILSYLASKYVIPQLQMCSRSHWCSHLAKNLGRRKTPPNYQYILNQGQFFQKACVWCSPLFEV